MRAIRVSTALLTWFVLVIPALALQPSQFSDDEVRQAIIRDSISAYLGTEHPCACPYNMDRAGHSCGRRSAYSRPGGAEPLCYPSDVTSRSGASRIIRRRHFKVRFNWLMSPSVLLPRLTHSDRQPPGNWMALLADILPRAENSGTGFTDNGPANLC
jgi:hypothetical protein